MSDAKETLVDVAAALRRLPGVSINDMEVRGGHLRLLAVIETLEAIGPIVYSADGANIRLDTWSTAPGTPVGERANPAHVRYNLSIGAIDDDPEQAIQRFQCFGNFLVWFLHGVGQLETNEANRLLTKWNGKHVADR